LCSQTKALAVSLTFFLRAASHSVCSIARYNLEFSKGKFSCQNGNTTIAKKLAIYILIEDIPLFFLVLLFIFNCNWFDNQWQ
jgi:flagellar biosynthesis protein FlhB